MATVTPAIATGGDVTPIACTIDKQKPPCIYAKNERDKDESYVRQIISTSKKVAAVASRFGTLGSFLARHVSAAKVPFSVAKCR